MKEKIIKIQNLINKKLLYNIQMLKIILFIIIQMNKTLNKLQKKLMNIKILIKMLYNKLLYNIPMLKIIIFIIIQLNMILNKLKKKFKQILIQIYLINLIQIINKNKQKK